jgi:1,4-dihydroxy-2-naphthoate octaprenyltransferase
MGHPADTFSRQTSPTHLAEGIWRLADPKITLASVASMLLGAAAAARDGSLSLPWLGLTVLAIFFIEAAKNASGELFDFESGTDQAVAPEDRSPFSGGKRVLVDGLLTRRQTRALAGLGYALGASVGLAIVLLREPRVLWLGVVGMACAFFYHAPPLKLSYRGLGEAAVALCYGPLIAVGTYLVQRGATSLSLLLVSLPLGLLIAAFLWINEFPDYRADRSAGKNTLVVRLGRDRAGRVFRLLVGSAFALLALLPALGLPWTVWLGFAGVPSAWAATGRLLRNPESTQALIPAQAATLHAFLLYAVGTGLGLLVTGGR